MKKAQQNKGQNRALGFRTADMDMRVRPQDDFFAFANGGWLKRNPIPKEEVIWGSFYILRNENLKKLKAILEETARMKRTKRGSDEQIVRDFYLSGMNEKVRAKRGLELMMKELGKIEMLKDADDLIASVADLHMRGIDALFSIAVSQDEKDSGKNALYIFQDGISLPDRDYYLKKDAKSKRIRVEYRKHIARVFRIFAQASRSDADAVMKIETSLAKASMTAVERRDVKKQYNKRTWEKLAESSPNISWREYFRRVGIREKNTREVIVAQPLFVKEVSAMLARIPLNEWKAYLKWRVLDDSAPLLGETFVRENFRFYGIILSGAKHMRPRWKRVAGMIDACIGESLGKLYVRKHFNTEAKRRINELADRLVRAYRKRIEELDWMSMATKKKALLKLARMRRKLGYPDRWKGYRGLAISPDSYLENAWAAGRFAWRRMVRKLWEEPDRREWITTPPTVNAFCHHNMNEIIFPAGIMQPPYFDPNGDMAVNYGAIGAIIGHEITHGFDDQGRLYDAQGNLRDWWTKRDRKKFEEKAKALARQFDSYEPAPGLRVNGRLTLGENIADLGGLIIAYYAFEEYLKGSDAEKKGAAFTPQQKFFLGAALAERAHIRPESLRNQVLTDPHSPAKFRINGPFSNMKEFYDAWGVKRGDKLWREIKNRVKIW